MENLKNQLSKTLHKFLIELEFGDFNIDENILKNIEKERENILEINDKIYNELIEYEKIFKEIYKNIKNNKSIDKNQFDFFNNLIFLNINFNIFEKENRNTKKNLLCHLYILLKFSKFIKKVISLNLGDEEITELYNKILNENPPVNQDTQHTQINHNGHQETVNPENSLNLDDTEQIGELVSSMLKDFKSGKINPIQMLNEVMSGNINNPNSEINKLSKKYEKQFKK